MNHLRLILFYPFLTLCAMTLVLATPAGHPNDNNSHISPEISRHRKVRMLLNVERYTNVMGSKAKLSYEDAADLALEAASTNCLPRGTNKENKQGTKSSNTFNVTDVMFDMSADVLVAVHVRLVRYYNDLYVIGGDLVVHINAADLSLLGISQTMQSTLQHISTDSIATIMGNTSYTNRDLVIYGRSSVIPTPILAWDITRSVIANDGTPMIVHDILDAITGTRVDRFSDTKTFLLTRFPSPNNLSLNYNYSYIAEPPQTLPTLPEEVSCLALEAAVGVGNSMYNGRVKLSTSFVDGLYYELKDPLRNCHCTRNDYCFGSTTSFEKCNDGNTFFDHTFYNIWGDRTSSNNYTATTDVHYGYAATFDFFLDMFGRQGVYNNGNNSGKVRSRVAQSGYRLNNAFWYNGEMTYGYGDGWNANPFTAFEIVAHEFIHGVTEATANLIYSGESGGLNEATSDILSILADFQTKDRPFYAPNYLIGESVFDQPGSFFRSMIQPSDDAFIYGGLDSSYDCYCKKMASVDVHLSSGVANHFFYLLAEGTINGIPSMTCNRWDCQVATGTNKTLVGIGKEKAGHIWYRALITYFTSDTNYAGAREATLRATKDLYSDTEVTAVMEAWAAVNVVAPFPSPTRIIPSPSTARPEEGKRMRKSLLDN